MNLEIRGVSYEMDEELKNFVEARLQSALGRFAGRIDRVVVRLFDVNGPRGGVDKHCRIAVDLIPRGVVRVESTGDDPFALVSLAAKRSRRSVLRALARRRRRMYA